MQPSSQNNQDDPLRARNRRYDAYYDPSRTYARAPAEPEPQALPVQPVQNDYSYQQANSYVPPHDVRSGYVPPQVSAYEYDPETAQNNYVNGQVSPIEQYVTYAQAPEPQAPPHIEPAHTQQYATHSRVSEHYEKKVPEAKAQKSKVFASIVKASVEIDRVTRQSVAAVRHTFEPPQIAALRSRRQKRLMRVFYTAAAFSMFATVYFGMQQVLFGEQNRQHAAQQKVLGAQTNAFNDATRDSEMPSEKTPTSQDMKTYLVAPPYPRYIRIPSINIEARIRRLGVDSNGAVGTPNNINDTGWYDSSVKPGDKEGASLIVGHLAGPTTHGIFWDLNKLTPGAKIEIEKGNGEVLSYRVTHVDAVQSDSFNISDYLKSETPGRNDLRLITSSGKYDNVTVQGSDRYVVFAQQVL